MCGVHFGNEERNVRLHAVTLRVAHHGIAGARKGLFDGPGHQGIKRGKDEVTIERRRGVLHDEAVGGLRDGAGEVPAHGVGIAIAGGALRRGNFGELEPGMLSEKMDEALADNAGGAEDSGAPAPLFLRTRYAIHAAPPGRGEPMRVPENLGLNVLRTQTVIPVSAASGRTWGCRTFAPLAANACASS